MSDPQPGEVFSRIGLGRVVGMAGDNVRVRSTTGLEYVMERAVFDRECQVAGRHDQDQKVTPTQMEAILTGLGDAVFKVIFHKKPRDDDAVAAIDAGWDGATLRQKRALVRQKRALVRQTRLGEKRILLGHLDPAHRLERATLGRVHVIDLLLDAPDNKRQVDPRTVVELVVNGTRYHT